MVSITFDRVREEHDLIVGEKQLRFLHGTTGELFTQSVALAALFVQKDDGKKFPGDKHQKVIYIAHMKQDPDVLYWIMQSWSPTAGGILCGKRFEGSEMMTYTQAYHESEIPKRNMWHEYGWKEDGEYQGGSIPAVPDTKAVNSVKRWKQVGCRAQTGHS